MNNAGTCTLKKMTEHTDEDYAKVMSTNVDCPYNLCQLAYPLLKASGDASVVFISSVCGLVGLPNISAYAASKGVYTYMCELLDL